MHFKCNLCFFMCLWCHYHLLPTEFQHHACFHTGTASEETPHMPRHRQVTPSNYSPGQYSKKSGLTDTWLTRVTFTHEHSPAGTTQTSCTQKGFCNRAQSKMVCRENSWCSHVSARDVAGVSTTATSVLGSAAEAPRGFCHEGTLHFNRTDLQDWTSASERMKWRAKTTTVSRTWTALQGEKNPTLRFQTIYCIMSWYVTKYISGYSEDKNL